jgi:hypothetical protein
MTSAAVPSTSAAISISAARLAIVGITSYQALLNRADFSETGSYRI